MQQVFTVGGNNGVDIQWYQGGGNIDVSMLTGNNALGQSINQDMTHPLLLNQETNFVGTNPNRSNGSSSRQALNDPEDAATLQIELLERAAAACKFQWNATAMQNYMYTCLKNRAAYLS